MCSIRILEATTGYNWSLILSDGKVYTGHRKELGAVFMVIQNIIRSIKILAEYESGVQKGNL